MKIATLFTPGSYGTFISWCVYSFSELNSDNKIVSSIEVDNGSAHKYRVSHGMNIVRPTHNLLDHSYTDYILIDCEKEKTINYLDNQFQKHCLGNLAEYINTFFPDINTKLKESWGSSNPWELRELLSFFLEDMIVSKKEQINNYHIQTQQQNNCYTIILEDFLINVPFELEKLLSFFNLKKHNKFDQIDGYVSKYLESQQNFTKHIQIEKFVNSTINNKSYSISNLTIFDEAWIQHKLRSQGFEIKCYNLNEFTKNSTELFKLIE
jgi:hypothetical protein